MISELTTAESRSRCCRTILEALPDWFGDLSAREDYIARSESMSAFAFLEDDQPLAFVGLMQHSAIHVEMAVLGVKPSLHRRGIGASLVKHAREWSVRHSAKILSVKTLSDKSADPHYAKTRLFYQAQGFQPFEEFPTLWGRSNPCSLLVSVLRA